MENILEKIISYKKKEVELRKRESPVLLLEKQSAFNREIFSMKKFIMDPRRNGIIAEYKKKSPSKGNINDRSSVEEVTAAYAKFGASMISVLTDSPSFGGSNDDLKRARFNDLPILRKDFIIDMYQIAESRAIGADVILLIAACLKPSETRYLAKSAHDYGMEVLLEIHGENELEHLCEEIDVVGINNRDLKTFEVDIGRSIRISELLPRHLIKIAESGIRNIETILRMKSAGFSGFLIGEQFMNASDPAIAFASFVDQLNKKLYESESLRNDATRSGKEA